MKLYFLGLATLVTVCLGCQTASQHLGQSPEDCPPGFEGGMMPQRGAYVNGGGHAGRNYVAPPASMMLRPGPMVDGPGPGVLNALGGPPARQFMTSRTQVRFVGPEGMAVGWQIPNGYAEHQIFAPGVYDFAQGAMYRLKLTDIPGREGVVVYPTLQVYPSHPQTDAYLSHNSVPLQITDEDLDQIESGNFVTKVIYLPSPAHQELAIAGVGTLVSTPLDPGIDPVAEADRRGTIMAVLRVGNMDLETPTSAGGRGGIEQASHVVQVDGEAGAFVPPMPIGGIPGVTAHAIPGPMLMGVPGGPGMPPGPAMAGAGPAPMYGMPITGTPIGLPGPTHLPYGGPAGLRSHTVRNRTKQHIPKPVNDVLVDVKHKPGIRLPEPVRHIKYEETHPVD